MRSVSTHLASSDLRGDDDDNAADNVVAIIENDRQDVYVYIYRCRARRCLSFPRWVRGVRFLFARGETSNLIENLE